MNASRRQFIKGSALAAAGLLGTPLTIPALAKAPMVNAQAPAFYRFKLGAFEATVISDGPLDLGEPKADIFVGMSKEQFTKSLSDHFLPTSSILIEQNALVINTGDQLVLFDTGTGSSKAFGLYSGRLISNLKAAGIRPEDVDAVALTHAHPDHCWGLLADDSARIFPNAQIYMAQSDFDFWTDESKAAGPEADFLKMMIAGTRKQLLPLRERITFFKDGQEFLPGIQAIAAPGHTVGHTVFMITSQGKTLCNAGDIAHHQIISLEQPHAAFSFDTDGKQGAQSRVRIFDMLATDRIPSITYHFSWPGLGYVGRQGSAYRFHPSPMQMTL